MTDLFGHSESTPLATPSAHQAERAIHDFLDLVQRPTGSREFSIPNSPQANRAILALFDVVGRNP